MTNQQNIKFAAPDKSLFFPTLKKRVNQYFSEHHKSKYANKTMVVKTIVLIAAYLVPYFVLIIFTPPAVISLLLWLLMGFAISGIGMSVMHDANHGAFSKNPSVNKWLGYTINLAGAGALNWKLQHNILHHTYTNIAGLDEDIKDRGVIKLSPHAKAGKLHRFQWIYAFFFYGILTLYWVLLKDFIQYYTFIKAGVNRQTRSQNKEMLGGLIRMKLIYIAVMLVVPVFVFKISFGQILVGFLLMHFAAGLVLTVIFQLAHSVEGAQHPLPDHTGIIAKDWAIHQLETTVNFSPRNKWLSWYIGGLNFQIEHHLFPKVCHVHYPQLAPIVRQTAQEFGLTYMENKTFLAAVRSHISSLKRFGMPSLNEAIV
ncbi:fatty acid desaturase family protein [Dyadobacter subterraneus]|uniref:Acyl-CoA desaturase n=1 Tax=Dyadobacter subterraneus TaxID=2773304 RepID=A0ABR9WCV1_9BACT|nr:acyl-CoA desaturase [Dyadobacter subterraneus]MBE9463295.1 acyl-CoA desaturase [Dyadobacter subterraneus]